jgi:hypothetical protein
VHKARKDVRAPRAETDDADHERQHEHGGVARPDATARTPTALSSALWIAAIISGRWIGYL